MGLIENLGKPRCGILCWFEQGYKSSNRCGHCMHETMQFKWPSITFDPSADVFLTCIPLPFMLGKNIILLIFVHLSTVVLGTSSDTGVIKPGWLENPLFIDDFLIKTSI